MKLQQMGLIKSSGLSIKSPLCVSLLSCREGGFTEQFLVIFVNVLSLLLGKRGLDTNTHTHNTHISMVLCTVLY